MGRTNTNLLIGVDVDDVVLNLMDNWLSIYNHDFNDNLKKEQVTDWDVSRFVHPLAKTRIYEYLENGLIFSNSKPVEGALNGIHILKSLGYRIIYITATNPSDIKFEWLSRNGFIDESDDFVVAKDKSLIRASMLIDDNYDNVSSFLGIGVLMNQPWNAKFRWSRRIDNWDDFIGKYMTMNAITI